MFGLVLAGSVACGGGGGGGNPVDRSQLVGLWTGTTTLNANGQSATSPASTHISNASASDEIVWGDVCGNGSGPNATVTAPTAFSIHAFSCPPGQIGSCSSAVFAVSGGQASLSGGTLTIAANGTVSGCGANAAYTLSFTGHK
ncbi:MAG TPA: hypothetical protein VI356_25720 [Myxococcales bacterium]